MAAPACNLKNNPKGVDDARYIEENAEQNVDPECLVDLVLVKIDGKRR